MNKAEAKQALLEGKKITWIHFNPEEWVKLDTDGKYLFEDGCRCTENEFWYHRTDKMWNENWSEFNDQRSKNTG